LRTLFKLRVLREEIKFQNLQSIELSEQKCCGVRHRSHGIVGMRLLPLREGLVCSREIQVVHLLKAAVEISGKRGIGRRGCCYETKDHECQTHALLQEACN